VSFDPIPLPFPAAYDPAPFVRRLGDLRLRPLRDAVRETVETFRAAVEEGRLDVDSVLG
jgi:hypothetical protein